MATIEFDVAAFRLMFPEFSSEADYPDATLEMNWGMATCYVSDTDYGCLSGSCRTLALNLMTAHLTKIWKDTEGGEDTASVQSASIDKVTITVVPPISKDSWQWWLNLTSYGQRLLALLQQKSVGGLYVGGRVERSAFRKVGGYF
jgi:hypothetical protein